VQAQATAATSNNYYYSGHPRYELRVENLGSGNLQLEVWQLPSAATPQITQPVRVAGLKGRNLALIENRILRRLAKADMSMGGLKLGKPKTFALDEEVALVLGLIFRVLAPMRSRDNMLACIEGIEAMSREEAAYWLGMAMHRKNPRRVLMSLRILLTDPHR
jgi:hypothetical protein